MRKLLLLILTLSMVSCSKQIYTNAKFFDCNKTSDFKADTDKRQLIYAILNRAVVSKKDIADYHLITDKTKIYLNDVSYSNFFSSMSMLKTNPIELNDVPNQIGNVKFCVKSESELQVIADKTNDFLYLTLGNIEINGDTAKIGLVNSWVISKKNKGKHVIMSGGGYIWEFKKVNGKWEFDKILRSFQS